jgi:hypothetical protein
MTATTDEALVLNLREASERDRAAAIASRATGTRRILDERSQLLASAAARLENSVPREQHDAELSDYALTMTRQRDLLTAAVEVLRGPPPALTTWSHHDIADLARALVTEHNALAAFITAARETQAAIYTAWLNRHTEWFEALMREQRHRFDAAPSVALNEHDHDVWAAGYEAGNEDRYGSSTPGGMPYDPTPNPYPVKADR